MRRRLATTGPLDWDRMLGYFALRAIAGVEFVDIPASTYRRTIVVDGEPGVIELTRGGPDHLVLRVATLNRTSTAGAVARRSSASEDGSGPVVPRARQIFALDRDPTDANAHLAGDPLLAPLVRSLPGMRVPGTWDPYETGVRAIVGQQVSVAGASTVTARIVARAGTPIAEALAGSAPGLTHSFPDPATLARADLTAIGMPGARVAAIQAFAAAVDKGEVPLDGSLPLDDLIAAICRVRGLGPWTAGYIALRMGEPDAFPAADLGLRRAARPGAPLTTAEMAARAEPWRPWRASAAVRLWLSEA